ncbi:MAG: hypothetical protein M1508_14195 [Nitrospirae bacterium]|nr:hypothetical protein [Nitrospirota bacterium]MCL5420964.1 hypothetical protein [Nitrospirota bacterium]
MHHNVLKGLDSLAGITFMNDFILQFYYKKFFHSELGPLQLIVSISFKKMLYIFCFFYTFLADYAKCGVSGLLVDEKCGDNQGPCSKTAGLTQKNYANPLLSFLPLLLQG